MEHIPGVAVDQYCRDRGLGPQDKLRLFRKVCEAVQFAHQCSVIHRDLKPSNILISRNGNPKLLDFGIAKLLTPEVEPITTWGCRPLTPDYASPEQLMDRPVTLAADIFALGGLLYELLTGQHPFRNGSTCRKTLHRRICEQDPCPPSRAQRAAGSRRARRARRATQQERDLDSIVLKALEKKPDDRYRSAQAFSDDIHRYLERQPVRARRKTLFHRLHKIIPGIRREAGLRKDY